jgi:hypothetical protein
MGVSSTCAANWRTRNYIPPWYWTRFIEMAEHRHNVIVTYRQLALMTECRHPSANRKKEMVNEYL